MSDDDIIYYDSSVSSLYTIELWWHIVTMFFLWPLFVLQILALRFTPKRLLNRTKVQLIGIGLAALIVQTARFHDPSSAFRRMSMTAQKALYSQLGCILMYAVILVTVAKARTLFVQMNKKMPQWFPVSVFGANVVSHIGATAVSIATGYYTENKDDSYFRKITNCNGAQVVIWNVNSISILVIYYFLYANLRSRIKAFQQDLIRTENAKRATAEQMKVQIPSPSSVPTSNGEDEDESAGRTAQTQAALSPTQTHTSIRVHPTSPTAATRATAATPGASSQSESRLKELDSAVRKMNILTVLLTFLLVGTTVSNIFPFVEMLKGNIMKDAILAPYETKDGSYRMAGAIQALVNQCGIGVVVWYAWSSPRLVLSSANRRQRGIQFWDTLIYGMKETATSVSYAAREVTSKKDVSKQGSGNKHASKQGSGNKPKIEVDVEPGANRATATAGTLTVSVGKTPLSPSVGALSPKSPALDGFDRPKGAEVSPLHMPRVAEEVEIAPIPEADAPKEVKPAW